MGNLILCKQAKDGSIYLEINALKPDSEHISSLEGRFKPIYPGDERHQDQEPNDVKRILSKRTVDQAEPKDENNSLAIVEQLTELVKAQRAYDQELAKLKAAQREYEQKLEILKDYT